MTETTFQGPDAARDAVSYLDSYMKALADEIDRLKALNGELALALKKISITENGMECQQIADQALLELLK